MTGLILIVAGDTDPSSQLLLELSKLLPELVLDLFKWDLLFVCAGGRQRAGGVSCGQREAPRSVEPNKFVQVGHQNECEGGRWLPFIGKEKILTFTETRNEEGRIKGVRLEMHV